ncbi:MAG: 6-carboxytetrahydropterin synthase [Marinilabiliales bacterium]|nr:6-carboxytetrahydropterin synthase [Marinilabiliales bacterium]
MASVIRVTKGIFIRDGSCPYGNYDGPCRNVHGHSYRLFVTIAGVPGCMKTAIPRTEW